MKAKYWILIVGLLFIILCAGCGSREVAAQMPENTEVQQGQQGQEGQGELTNTLNNHRNEELYATETQEIPKCFRVVIQQIEDAEKENGRINWEDGWNYGLFADPAINTNDYYEEDPYIYEIKGLELAGGRRIEEAYFDLTMYQSDSIKWSPGNAFYNEMNDTVYLWSVQRAYGSTDDYRTEENNLLFLLVEFKVETPQDYTVTVFHSNESNSGGVAWFHMSHCIDNILYQNTDHKIIWAIDLITKELHLCREELEVAEETIAGYADEYLQEGIDLGLISFGARTKVDDVIIYGGSASDKSNWDMMAGGLTVYVAYRGKELVGTMVIDEVTGEYDIVSPSGNISGQL